MKTKQFRSAVVITGLLIAFYSCDKEETISRENEATAHLTDMDHLFEGRPFDVIFEIAGLSDQMTATILSATDHLNVKMLIENTGTAEALHFDAAIKGNNIKSLYAGDTLLLRKQEIELGK